MADTTIDVQAEASKHAASLRTQAAALLATADALEGKEPVLDLLYEIDTDLAMLARYERQETTDTKVADRATRRLNNLGKILGYGKEE